jgi:hypothetical protein
MSKSISNLYGINCKSLQARLKKSVNNEKNNLNYDFGILNYHKPCAPTSK